jgi:hypothetical protein
LIIITFMDTQASRIVRKFESKDVLAKAIGLSRNSISAWVRVGWIPAHRQESVWAAARKLGIKLTFKDWFPSI